MPLIQSEVLTPPRAAPDSSSSPEEAQKPLEVLALPGSGHWSPLLLRAWESHLHPPPAPANALCCQRTFLSGEKTTHLAALGLGLGWTSQLASQPFLGERGSQVGHKVVPWEMQPQSLWEGLGRRGSSSRSTLDGPWDQSVH